jgi:hypothetical protein
MGDIDYESATLAAPPGQGGLATQGLSTKARSAGGGGVVRIWRAAETLDTLSVLKSDGTIIDVPWSGNVKAARRAGTGVPTEAATTAPTDDYIEALRQKRDEALAAKRATEFPPVLDENTPGRNGLSRSEIASKAAKARHAKARAAKGEAA